MMSSSMDQIFSKVADRIYVVGMNRSHIAVQMHNYGYTLVKGKARIQFGVPKTMNQVSHATYPVVCGNIFNTNT